MKKLGVLFFILSISSLAHAFIYEGLKYDITDPNEGTCVLIGAVSNLKEGDLIVPESALFNNKWFKIIGIHDFAFFKNTELESVKLPSTLRTIGICAFANCTSLKTINFPDSLNTIKESAFSGSSLISIIIPKSLTKIDERAFSGCENLKEIIVEEGNEVYASLEGVLFDKELKTLIQVPGSFTSYTIPEHVTTIGVAAFSSCNSLSSVTIHEGITFIDRTAFSSCPSLNSVTIHEGVKYIGEFAFSFCDSLTEITLPNSLEHLDWGSFAGCKSLSKVNLSTSLTSIPTACFESCSSLQEITLPESVEYIGNDAFTGISLKSITVLANEIVTLYSRSFGKISDTTLYVPSHLVNSYKDDDWWSGFAQILPLEERPETGGVEEIKVDQALPFDVYNLSGVLVRRNAMKDNLTDFTPGVYILRQGNASQKFMVR